MPDTLTNVCGSCSGKHHGPLEVLKYDPTQRKWLCKHCMPKPKRKSKPKVKPNEAQAVATGSTKADATTTSRPPKSQPKRDDGRVPVVPHGNHRVQQTHPKTREAPPPLILDGLVHVYSTCRDCGQIMQVTNVRDTVHPMCQPRPTRMENWEQSWLAITKSAPYENIPINLQRKLDDLEFKMETEADQMQPTALHNAAMQYAEWGWPVFPLAKNSKKPAIPRDKGGKGFLDATTDVKRICKWWSRHSDHNIGLATGHLFDVVDIDPDKGGVQSLSDLLQTNSIPFVHGIVATAGADEPEFRPSGMHLYVKPTGKGNYAGIRPGIDYRGRGGYVVAPPSTLGSRVRSWSWAVQPSPEIKGVE